MENTKRNKDLMVNLNETKVIIRENSGKAHEASIWCWQQECKQQVELVHECELLEAST